VIAFMESVFPVLAVVTHRRSGMMGAMPSPIEDYAVIGDTQTIALVGLDGSIDWLCLPRFDSGACFAALLGDEAHGRWLLTPAGDIRSVRRRYRGDSLVLETEYETDDGCVRLVDLMPPRHQDPDVIRVVEGVRGRVPMRMQLVIRFDYGAVVPWARRVDGAFEAIAGPDALTLFTDVRLHGKDMTTVAEFEVGEGDRVPFCLVWHPSHEPAPPRRALLEEVEDTEAWWSAWSAKAQVAGEPAWQDAQMRSLITLKALTYQPTGGIVAAATTSLPERIGGARNWDYRYCWLRDATLTLYSLLNAGFLDEAVSWRDWLLRAVAGDPADLQIMYGPAGERRLAEYEADWLPGYESSRPVRIGNAASEQFQLDVYGEVLDALHQAQHSGVDETEASWDLQRVLLDFVETQWRQPDEGIWEVRGPRRHFTHSKVMAWVAFDRAICAVEAFGHAGPVDRWRACRAEIHDEVLRQGFDRERNTFTQYYGSKTLDAATLMIPLVGFLPASDPRMLGTVAAIERDLLRDGFVMRYDHDEHTSEVDGLPPGEGAFLACTFWLVDNYALQGRRDEAVELFERLLALRNDVGLLSEEYDPQARRLVGNFPQAFSHVSLVNSARMLASPPGAVLRGEHAHG
jgi:GH15 family glucan-1,4-alpha-glucosidase